MKRDNCEQKLLTAETLHGMLISLLENGAACDKLIADALRHAYAVAKQEYQLVYKFDSADAGARKAFELINNWADRDRLQYKIRMLCPCSFVSIKLDPPMTLLNLNEYRL